MRWVSKEKWVTAGYQREVVYREVIDGDHVTRANSRRVVVQQRHGLVIPLHVLVRLCPTRPYHTSTRLCDTLTRPCHASARTRTPAPKTVSISLGPASASGQHRLAALLIAAAEPQQDHPAAHSPTGLPSSAACSASLAAILN